ncbi:MAG: hypothetical protein KKB30_10020 [Proteobacteria bacterium]|nr:hypothetical protein [Pseudomonadota bacterium]MBU1716386.1 hypothetical protein [Pseudomonadota bacterium]
MFILKKHFIKIVLLSLCGMLIFTNTSFAEENDSFELNATIMKIDLGNKMMVVAEKDIHLLIKNVKGKMHWQTIFRDAKGNTISPNTLKLRDRVLVQIEEESSGKLIALEVQKVK